MFHLKEGYTLRRLLLYGFIFVVAAAAIWVVLQLLGFSLPAFWWMFLLVGAVVVVHGARLMSSLSSGSQ